jgi:hypothetical protein
LTSLALLTTCKTKLFLEKMYQQMQRQDDTSHCNIHIIDVRIRQKLTKNPASRRRIKTVDERACMLATNTKPEQGSCLRVLHSGCQQPTQKKPDNPPPPEPSATLPDFVRNIL